MSRKIRSDAKVFVLVNMPHHQQDALTSWLLEEGISYKKAIERLHLDFGVTATKGALETFWERVCSPRQFARVAEAADALPEATGGLEANWQASSRAMVRQRYFQLLAARNSDPQEIATFAAQIAAMDKADLDRDTLKFNRQKTALAARLKRQTLRQDLDKFRHKVKSDTQKALDAFYAEIKSNAAALSAFAKLKEAVEAAVA